MVGLCSSELVLDLEFRRFYQSSEVHFLDVFRARANV